MVDEPINNSNEREPAVQTAGRFLGIVVFLVGITMLVVAFMLAYQAFHDPNRIIPFASVTQTPAPAPTEVYVLALLRLVLLFVMGYLGSLIAARGAQLFFSAKREIRRAAGD